MIENIPTPGGGADMTTEAFLARAPETSLLRLTVRENAPTGSDSRLLRLAGDDLAGFAYAPGQDLMFLVDTSGGRIIRRRYTIRRFDADAREVELRVVVDLDGPGARWVRGLEPGDRVEAIGPRGKITVVDGVPAHLFVGDDVSLPAIAAMVEALPAGSRATVIVEVATKDDADPVAAPAGVELDWTWLYRDGRPAGEAEALLAAVDAAELGDGPTHAYVFGEARVVVAVRSALADRRVPADRMSPKAYWGRGRSNASHGEPLKS